MIINFEYLQKGAIEYLIGKINQGLYNNYKDRDIQIVFRKDMFASPEVLAPIAGIMDHLRSVGYNVKFRFSDNLLKTTGLREPYTVDKNKYQLFSPMFKVWRFNTPEEIWEIEKAMVEHINTKKVCAPGVIEAFEWTVYEVMDNVLQHSQSSYGYIACTITSNSQISVAIYDNGIGIYKSFVNSRFRLKTQKDAIIMAMKENTTSNPKKGQGNGLWGMSRLLANNKGTLSITSTSSIVTIEGNNEPQFAEHNATINTDPLFIMGTLVDFQFIANNPVSFSDVFSSNYEFTNLGLEALEDEKNRIHLYVKDFSFGYASRTAGEMARNYAMNRAIQSNHKQIIVIDFIDISIVASSFADEFLGKLVAHYGFLQFNSLFRVVNVSDNNMAIINRSIMQRLSNED